MEREHRRRVGQAISPEEEDRVFKHPFSLPSAPGKALDIH